MPLEKRSTLSRRSPDPTLKRLKRDDERFRPDRHLGVLEDTRIGGTRTATKLWGGRRRPRRRICRGKSERFEIITVICK